MKRHKQMKHTLQKCEECEFSTYKNREFTNHMLGMHENEALVKLTYQKKT